MSRTIDTIKQYAVAHEIKAKAFAQCADELQEAGASEYEVAHMRSDAAWEKQQGEMHRRHLQEREDMARERTERSERDEALDALENAENWIADAASERDERPAVLEEARSVLRKYGRIT